MDVPLFFVEAGTSTAFDIHVFFIHICEFRAERILNLPAFFGAPPWSSFVWLLFVSAFYFDLFWFFWLFFLPQEDEKFLTEVFAQLTDEATEDSKRRELVSQTMFKSPVQMLSLVRCWCGWCSHCCEAKMCSVMAPVLWIYWAICNALNFSRVKDLLHGKF